MKLRSLFPRVFLWFWATLVVGSLVVGVATMLSSTQPIGARWARVTQDLYARSAVDFYTTGGAASLTRYLDQLRANGMEGHLLDATGLDVLTGEDRSADRAVTRTLHTGSSSLRWGHVWHAASPIVVDGKRWTFLLLVNPLGGFVDGTFSMPLLSRLLLLVLIAGGCSLLLARSLAKPIRALQHGALALAGGDLHTRVQPAVGIGFQELEDTAAAFDMMAERLESAVSRRDQLLADISHELRSPLTRMSVHLELLRRGEAESIEAMERDLQRVDAMIGKLLMLARLDNAAEAPSQTSVAMVPLLQSIVADAAIEGRPRGVLVVFHDGGACAVAGDADLLRSCVENVVRNAVRFSPDGGTVHVRTSVTRDSISTVVEDRGPGVEEAMLPLIFEPFFRADNGRTPGSETHAGLGLSIAQRAAVLHGGMIRASNRQDGAGLAVSVVLPCVADAV